MSSQQQPDLEHDSPSPYIPTPSFPFNLKAFFSKQSILTEWIVQQLWMTTIMIVGFRWMFARYEMRSAVCASAIFVCMIVGSVAVGLTIITADKLDIHFDRQFGRHDIFIPTLMNLLSELSFAVFVFTTVALFKNTWTFEGIIASIAMAILTISFVIANLKGIQGEELYWKRDHEVKTMKPIYISIALQIAISFIFLFTTPDVFNRV